MVHCAFIMAVFVFVMIFESCLNGLIETAYINNMYWLRASRLKVNADKAEMLPLATSSPWKEESACLRWGCTSPKRDSLYLNC